MAVILLVNGKESIPAKHLLGSNRQSITQYGDMGALTLDNAHMDLLAIVDAGTKALFGSSGLKGKGDPEAASQFPDRFPFMRIFQEGQMPVQANSLSLLRMRMGTVADRDWAVVEEQAGNLL
jgi:hypothetical protein